MGNWNCHCHSCTSASRFITENHPEGTTQLSDITNNTGSAMSVYNLKDTIFVEGSPQDNFGYVKVGEKGKAVRSYTKCCGTQAFTSGMPVPISYRHFNRNCIYNEDGTKYIPDDPVPNIMLSYAFVDPSVISAETPKYNYIPLSLLGLLVPDMIKTMLGLSDMGKMANEPAMFFKPEDVDEIVPITWE